MRYALSLLIASAIIGSAAAAQDHGAKQRSSTASRPRVYKLDELTWPQIDAFDRQRTLFILAVGAIEQHGPHLPTGADTYGVNYEADVAARRVSRALPEVNVVMMPAINYGHGGANEIAGKRVHPGTYGIRHTTLRSLVADVGGPDRAKRFQVDFRCDRPRRPCAQHRDQRGVRLRQRNVSGHDAAYHDSVSRRFGAPSRRKEDERKVFFRRGALVNRLGRACRSERDIRHVGCATRSGTVQLQIPPEQSRSHVRRVAAIATAPNWQGYLSAPAKATAAHGRAVEAWWIDGMTNLILRAVRGENMFAHARMPETVPPPVASVAERARADDAAFEARLSDWLARRPKR